jgi:hypothetical protein
MKPTLAILLCALLLGACARKATDSKGRTVYGVNVTKSGEIFYEKRRVSIDELMKEVNQLPKSGTAVCFHIEEPERAREVSQKAYRDRSARAGSQGSRVFLKCGLGV